MVEDAQVSFDAAVQKGRSLTDKQLADAKTGGVFGAAEALDRKLIDGIKSFDAVVNDLAAEAKRFQRAANQTRAAGPVPQRSSTMEETTTTTAGAADNLATVKAELDAQLALSRQAAAAELLRQQKIADVCGTNRALAAKAIGENWSVEKAELQALKRVAAVGGIATAGPNIVTGVGRHRPGAAELIPACRSTRPSRRPS
jgi:ClpP class serine protease